MLILCGAHLFSQEGDVQAKGALDIVMDTGKKATPASRKIDDGNTDTLTNSTYHHPLGNSRLRCPIHDLYNICAASDDYEFEDIESIRKRHGFKHGQKQKIGGTNNPSSPRPSLCVNKHRSTNCHPPDRHL